MKTVKIEMIHDVVCSWCHIGYRNISVALASLPQEIDVEFSYLPFELNPGLRPEGVEINTHLRERNGWSEEEASQYRRSLLQTTKEVGVTIDFSKRTHYYATDKAHRLLLAAQERGLQRHMHEALLHAYHVDGANISDADVLIALGRKNGLSNTEARSITTTYWDEHYRALQTRMREFGVRSVPAFVFNGTDFVSGSNSVEFFRQTFRQYGLATQKETAESCHT